MAEPGVCGEQAEEAGGWQAANARGRARPPTWIVGCQGGCQTRSPFLGFGGKAFASIKTTLPAPHSAPAPDKGTGLESPPTAHPRQPGELA